MEPSGHRDKDSLQSYEQVSVDADDVRSARYRNSDRPSPVYRYSFALLTVIAAVGYVLFNSSELLRSAVNQVTAPRKPLPIQSASSNPVPPIYTADALIAPRPLADCIKPDNIIDEAVATCRYGHFPRAVHNPSAQGMVSASYMATYQAGQQPARSKRVTTENVEKATVWQWDGKRTYAAQWLISENRIDGSSVCANYRRGSIDYRECRKGAKIYFREKCREWGKRRSSNQTDTNKMVEQRFCSAGEGFNPLS